MLVVMIMLGLFFFLSMYKGDVTGAVTFAFVLVVLGWVLWGERKKDESNEKRP
jgi:hypothetical protein